MFQRVAIIGVGLIGGSIALALRSRGLAAQIVGIGRRPQSVATALERGVIDEGVVGIGPELGETELVIGCTPVETLATQIEQVAPLLPEGAWITDAGSTKARLCRQIDQTDAASRFVGSHPIAGSERSGVGAARADLFQGKPCVLTPTDTTPAELVDRANAFWWALGMRTVAMAPEEHDAVLARTSHTPHLAAVALCLALADGDGRLAGTGLLDTTRIAAGDAPLWLQICRENRQPILEAIDRLDDRLAAIRSALDAGDDSELERLLHDARSIRRDLGS